MDRDKVLDALKAAFADGRLTKEEFDLRVALALAAYSEIDSLTADLPAAPVVPVDRPDPKRLIKRGTSVGTGVSVVLAATVLVKFGIVGIVVGGAVAGVFTSLLLAGFLTLLSWFMERNSARHATPRGPAGQAYRAESRRALPRGKRDPREGAQISRVSPALG